MIATSEMTALGREIMRQLETVSLTAPYEDRMFVFMVQGDLLALRRWGCLTSVEIERIMSMCNWLIEQLDRDDSMRFIHKQQHKAAQRAHNTLAKKLGHDR